MNEYDNLISAAFIPCVIYITSHLEWSQLSKGCVFGLACIVGICCFMCLVPPMKAKKMPLVQASMVYIDTPTVS